jgi:hypothetical protein
MNNHEVIGSVRLSFALGLKPWNNEPSAYAFPASGDIVASLDAPGDLTGFEIAGRVELTVIKFTEAYNDHVDIADVFCEVGFEDVHSTFFEKDGDFKKPMEDTMLPGEIIIIETLKLEPKYRHTRLLVQAVETIIPSFSSNSLVIARRATLDRGDKEWHGLAFDPVHGTDFVYRHNSEIDPRRKPY